MALSPRTRTGSDAAGKVAKTIRFLALFGPDKNGLREETVGRPKKHFLLRRPIGQRPKFEDALGEMHGFAVHNHFEETRRQV